MIEKCNSGLKFLSLSDTQIVFLMNFSCEKEPIETICNKHRMRCKHCKSLTTNLLKKNRIAGAPNESLKANVDNTVQIQSWPQAAVFCRPAHRPQPDLTSISFPTFTPVSSRWPRNSWIHLSLLATLPAVWEVKESDSQKVASLWEYLYPEPFTIWGHFPNVRPQSEFWYDAVTARITVLTDVNYSVRWHL